MATGHHSTVKIKRSASSDELLRRSGSACNDNQSMFKDKPWESDGDEGDIIIPETGETLANLSPSDRRVAQLLAEVRLAQAAQFEAESRCLTLQAENARLRAMLAKVKNSPHIY